jgi:hypothetical protein
MHLHLVGFAALFGGTLVQLRSARPEVNAAMLHGALTALVTGVALIGSLAAGLDPTVQGDPDYVQAATKLGVTAALVVLVVKNRKFSSIPRGLLALLGGLTLVNAALGVLWE